MNVPQLLSLSDWFLVHFYPIFRRFAVILSKMPLFYFDLPAWKSVLETGLEKVKVRVSCYRSI